LSALTAKKRERVLDPIERSSEVLFALIMVLSFTGSISVAAAGREEVGEVLIGAVGCNLAWGIIDAVMYVMMVVSERGRMLTIGRAVRDSQTPEQGRARLVDGLPDEMSELFDTDALERARQNLIALPLLPERPRMTLRDFKGAVGVFLFVFLSTFPVVAPFLFVTPLPLAMRVSNGVAVVMLYIAGHLLGLHAGLRPVRTGLAMVAVGAVLVAVTIALGG
jgi:hypothetical protein